MCRSRFTYPAGLTAAVAVAAFFWTVFVWVSDKLARGPWGAVAPRLMVERLGGGKGQSLGPTSRGIQGAGAVMGKKGGGGEGMLRRLPRWFVGLWFRCCACFL